MKKYWFVQPDCYNKHIIDNYIVFDKGSYYDHIDKSLFDTNPNGIYLTIDNYKGFDIIGFMPYPNAMKGTSKQWLIDNGYIYMGELSRKTKLEKLKELSNEY